MSTGKKRFWSYDEKREICTQAATAGFSVAQVARRYAMNANLIHKWLKDPRFAPLFDGSDEFVDAAFLPVEVDAAPPLLAALVDQAGPPLCAVRVDFTLSDGRRVLIEGPTALVAVLGLVEGLMS
jgi:transposase